MGLDVPHLDDRVVRLRPPAPADADALTTECQDPEIPRFTRVPSPYRRADALQFIEDTVRQWHAGTSAAFVIADATTDALLGSIGLMRIHEERLVAEIGYWVAAGARRRGIATRAVRLVARWAALDLGIVRTELMTRVENVASQGVAERAGFTREGVLRSYLTQGCGLSDVVMFSMLPSDLDREQATPDGSARG